LVPKPQHMKPQMYQDFKAQLYDKILLIIQHLDIYIYVHVAGHWFFALPCSSIGQLVPEILRYIYHSINKETIILFFLSISQHMGYIYNIYIEKSINKNLILSTFLNKICKISIIHPNK